MSGYEGVEYLASCDARAAVYVLLLASAVVADIALHGIVFAFVVRRYRAWRAR